MKQLTQSHWFELGELSAVVGPTPRKRRSVQPPETFLVLGPRETPTQTRPRPTRCAGTWNGERVTITHGALGAQQLEELERKLREITG